MSAVEELRSAFDAALHDSPIELAEQVERVMRRADNDVRRLLRVLRQCERINDLPFADEQIAVIAQSAFRSLSGITAIELRGYTHYSSFGAREVVLFGNPGMKLPSWFQGHSWSRPVALLTSSVFAGTQKTTSTLPVDEVDLEVATLERAAFEMMYLVPKRQSYEEAFQVMESLMSLRPQVVQQLLEGCTSVKTKRLFMHTAERAKHSCLKHIDLSKIDFGSGRRTIRAGGRLDKKYDLAVASVRDFVLKGGTAINLFLRHMPRLSVDIDLTYLPVSDRETALTDIHVQLALIAEELKRTVPGINAQLVEGDAPKLLVDASRARIKVEPSVVIRGSLVPPVSSELCPAAQDAYEPFVEIQRLDSADLYAGKLCAALDRQHPRDLFDVMHLQASGPIPESSRQAFVAYVAGHRRPIAELLQPNRKPIEDLFANHFAGMTELPVELA